jgi:hypothetical protein
MSDTTTPNLGLPYLDPSQAQPEVKINEAWDILDAQSLDIFELGQSPDVIVPNAKGLVFVGASVTQESTGKALVAIREGLIQVTWTNDLSAISVPINTVTRFVPARCKLKRVTVLTEGGSGSCTIYVWRSNVANHYPPISGDDLTGGNNVVISSGTTLDESGLSGWETELLAGDVLLFTLDASSTFSSVQINLSIQ